MRIGVDIDDTIVDTTKRIVQYVAEHFAIADKEEALNIAREVLFSDFQDSKSLDFVQKHFINIAESAAIKENAKEVLKRLSDRHEIYIITARSDEMFKSIDMTIDYLKDYQIPHDKLITGAFNKVDDCKEHAIDLMIDDMISTIETVKNAGIKTLLFNSDSNREMPSTSDRVDDWLEVERYILELEKQS